MNIDGKAVDIPESRQAGQGDLALGVRPEHIHIDEKSHYRGRVVTAEYLGTTQIITLETPNGEIKARISSANNVHAGDILIGGHSMRGATPAQRNVAMVFQQYSLYPHLTVRENLAFPLKSPLLETSAAEIKRKINEVAEVLQISHKLDNKATALSGGEMQRVSIGRALVRTHVGVLDRGRLVQIGSPREVYENPVSVYAAGRLGQPRINILPADLFSGAPAQADRIGLRPEQILQGEGEDSVVTRVEQLGDQTRLHLSLKQYYVVTVTDAHTTLRSGDIVKIKPHKPFYFSADGARIA